MKYKTLYTILFTKYCFTLSITNAVHGKCFRLILCGLLVHPVSDILSVKPVKAKSAGKVYVDVIGALV